MYHDLEINFTEEHDCSFGGYMGIEFSCPLVIDTTTRLPFEQYYVDCPTRQEGELVPTCFYQKSKRQECLGNSTLLPLSANASSIQSEPMNYGPQYAIDGKDQVLE